MPASAASRPMSALGQSGTRKLPAIAPPRGPHAANNSSTQEAAPAPRRGAAGTGAEAAGPAAPGAGARRA